MYYLKSFVKNLGMGEWAPPFFYSASPTPPGGLLGDRLWLMGGGRVVSRG
jgi:hypothetical protein